MTTTQAREYLTMVAALDNIYARVAADALEAGKVDVRSPRGQWSHALLQDLGIKRSCGLVALANRMSCKLPV